MALPKSPRWRVVYDTVMKSPRRKKEEVVVPIKKEEEIKEEPQKSKEMEELNAFISRFNKPTLGCSMETQFRKEVNEHSIPVLVPCFINALSPPTEELKAMQVRLGWEEGATKKIGMVIQAPRLWGKTACLIDIILNFVLSKSSCNVLVCGRSERCVQQTRTKLEATIFHSGFIDWVCMTGSDYIVLTDPSLPQSGIRKNISFLSLSSIENLRGINGGDLLICENLDCLPPSLFQEGFLALLTEYTQSIFTCRELPAKGSVARQLIDLKNSVSGKDCFSILRYGQLDHAIVSPQSPSTYVAATPFVNQ